MLAFKKQKKCTLPIAFGCCYGGYGRGTFSVAAPARIQLQLSASAILRSCHSSIGCHSHTLAHALLKLFEFLDLEWKFTSFFLADAEWCACAFKRNSGKPTLVSTGVGKMKEKIRIYLQSSTTTVNGRNASEAG